MENVLILGGSGRLGRSIQKVFGLHKIPFLSPPKSHLNVCNYKDLERFVSEHEIRTIIHGASILTPRLASSTQAIEDSKISTLIDDNVFKVVQQKNIKLFYTSTSLVYPCRSETRWSEGDFGPFPEPPVDRRLYAIMKYESTRKVLRLSSLGFDSSVLVLPNLLAGPIPNLDRSDQLCEKLFNLVENATENESRSISFDTANNPNLQLVAGFEIAEWISKVLVQEVRIPSLLNLSSVYVANPFQLLVEIANQKHFDGVVLANGFPKESPSYLMQDSLARISYFWNGGESLSKSVKMWLAGNLNGKLS